MFSPSDLRNQAKQHNISVVGRVLHNRGSQMSSRGLAAIQGLKQKLGPQNPLLRNENTESKKTVADLKEMVNNLVRSPAKP